MLAKDGASLPEIVTQQIEALGDRIDQARALRERLTQLRDVLARGGEPVASDWLAAVELITQYDQYCSSDELKRLLAHSKSNNDEWPSLIADVRAALARGVAPESEEAQALADRWRQMIMSKVGGDTTLAIKMKLAYFDQPELQARIQARSGLDSAVIEYLWQIWRHGHVAIWARLLPDLDLSRRIVYRIEGMPNTTVRRRLVYKRDGGAELSMDVYVPPTRLHQTGSPTILFVHGGPIPREMTAPTEWGVFTSYGELAAALGLVGVVFNHRLYAQTDYETAQSDMMTAIDYVRSHADELDVDGDSIAVWAFSGGGPLVAWCLRDRPSCLRCLVAFYALLDVRHILPPNADPELAARARAFSAAAHLGKKSTTLPMFVARAGLDAALFNDSIDLFVREALASNALLDLANHPQGRHGFDFLDDNERSREIIGRAVAFVKAHLSRS